MGSGRRTSVQAGQSAQPVWNDSVGSPSKSARQRPQRRVAVDLVWLVDVVRPVEAVWLGSGFPMGTPRSSPESRGTLLKMS